MRLYQVLSPVRAARVRYEPGEFVELDEAEGDALAARGIVEAAEAESSGYAEEIIGTQQSRPDVSEPGVAVNFAGNAPLVPIGTPSVPLKVDIKPVPSKTELSKYNKQELLTQAKAEGVRVEEGATNKAILDAILAARPQG